MAMTEAATPLRERLRDTAAIWARSQYELVTLAAEFAECRSLRSLTELLAPLTTSPPNKRRVRRHRGVDCT